jgi:hypothetical protein
VSRSHGKEQKMGHHTGRTSGLRLGLTLLACGLALGAASAVAVGNALFDMAR